MNLKRNYLKGGNWGLEMNEENEKKLFSEYPEFFKHKEDLHQSLMAFGFECEDGWYDLLSNLCRDIKAYYLKAEGNVNPDFYVTQVKEKYGSLRFYVSPAPDEVHNMIHIAEMKSYYICEDCGCEGKEFHRDDLPWIRTLCDDCLDRHIMKRYKRVPSAGENYISKWQKEHNAPFVEG